MIKRKKKKRVEVGRRKRYPLKTGVVVLREGKVKKSVHTKTKEKRRTVQRKSFEDTRIQIRNFIEELERKAEEKDEGPSLLLQEYHHLNPLRDHHGNLHQESYQKVHCEL